MKTITTIFESILGDNKDLVWSPEDARRRPDLLHLELGRLILQAGVF